MSWIHRILGGGSRSLRLPGQLVPFLGSRGSHTALLCAIHNIRVSNDHPLSRIQQLNILTWWQQEVYGHFRDVVRKLSPELIDRAIQLLEGIALKLIVGLVEKADEASCGD